MIRPCPIYNNDDSHDRPNHSDRNRDNKRTIAARIGDRRSRVETAQYKQLYETGRSLRQMINLLKIVLFGSTFRTSDARAEKKRETQKVSVSFRKYCSRTSTQRDLCRLCH